MKNKIIYILIAVLLLTGCNRKVSNVDSEYSNDKTKENLAKEQIKDLTTEEKDFLTFLDFENSYAMCKSFILDYYNNKNLKGNKDISIYFDNSNLHEFTSLLIEREPQLKARDINFGLVKFDINENKNIYLKLIMKVGDEESSYTEEVGFLIVNKQGKFKIADWIVVGKGMHGNYNNSDLRGLETLTDIHLWEDNSYADKMINEIKEY